MHALVNAGAGAGASAGASAGTGAGTCAGAGGPNVFLVTFIMVSSVIFI